MSQVDATYNLLVDLNGDGDFVDTNEDIAAYMRSFDTQVGCAGPYDRMGRSNTLKALLLNSTHRFSPEHGSALSGFSKGKVIKLTMTYSAVTRTLYTGRMSEIDPNVFENRDRRTGIQCNGLFSEWQGDQLLFSPLEDVRSDEVVAAILDGARIKPVGLVGWRIGVTGFSEIGSTTRVRAGSDFGVLDTGKQSFSLVGDNWSNGVSPFAALKSIAEAEWGRAFEGPDGLVYFWNRHRFAQDLPNALDGTFSDANSRDMSYQFGKRTVNMAKVSCRQRTVDTSISVLAATEEDIKIKQNSSQVITLNYRNAAGAKIGGKNLIKPVPYVDFYGYKHTLNPARENFTPYLNIMAQPISGGVRWTVFNSYHHPVRLKAGAQQRGIRIVDFGTVDRVAYGGSGSGKFETSLAVLEDANAAQDLADYIIAERQNDRGMIESISFNANTSDTMMLHAVNRAIGDRIEVSETQTGHSGEYFIIGRKDSFKNRIHRVTFILEPAPAPVWLIGTAGFTEMGSTTRAGF